MTPEEAWTSTKPDISHLKVFGCRALAHVPKEKRRKWDEKVKECLFMGYCEDSVGYRLINPKTKSVFRSRDVVFFENPQTVEEVVKLGENTETSFIPLEILDKQQIEDSEYEKGSEMSEEPEMNNSREDSAPEDVNPDNFQEIRAAEAAQQPALAPINIAAPVRRSERIPEPRNFGDDFLMYLTAEDAMSKPDHHRWKEAIDEEIQSLKENDTWKAVSPPRNKRILDTKWVLKTKINASGEIERYKASRPRMQSSNRHRLR